MDGTLSPEETAQMDAWWRAANYLTVGQIYLRGNPPEASRWSPSPEG